MKLYTKTGDGGETSIKSGRVQKTSTIIEAIGSIDELDAFVGDAYVKCHALPPQDVQKIRDLMSSLKKIQTALYIVQGVLAEYQKIDEKCLAVDVEYLEQKIDEFTEEVPKLTHFIRPGVTELDAKLHICRVTCRRAERRLWKALETFQYANSFMGYLRSWYYYYHPSALPEPSESELLVLRYLNRLSDFFFAAARYATHMLGENDDVLSLKQ